MNRHIATVVVAPMTTKGRGYPTRVACRFQGKTGQIVLNQIRTVDKPRLIKHLGQISPDEQSLVLETLAEMFAESWAHASRLRDARRTTKTHYA